MLVKMADAAHKDPDLVLTIRVLTDRHLEPDDPGA
jgi:hypothetical protein